MVESQVSRRWKSRLSLVLSFCSLTLASGWASAQTTLVARPLAPLKSVKVPLPSNLGDFIQDRQAAIALGKALFWDMQAGSDGLTACATCHWHAGADARISNTLGLPNDNPHKIQLRNPVSKLAEWEFPFVRVDDPNTGDDVVSPNAKVVENREEIVGSKGVERRSFVKIVNGQAVEVGNRVSDPDFSTGGVNLRTVTSRNSPSVINAVFNHRNNWDGSASFFFNGVNGVGKLDPNARVLKAGFYYDNAWLAYLDKLHGTRLYAKSRNDSVAVLLDNASLASQAMNPPTKVEMIWTGRDFKNFGRKMFSLRPLGKQEVYFTDSTLGPFKNWNGKGLWTNYNDLVRKAFKEEWWGSRAITPDGFTQMESNWGLYWGLSLLMYQSTLVSDDTPLDRFLAGDSNALSANAKVGLNIFTGNLVPGQPPVQSCNICHSGPEMTAAAIGEIVQADGSQKPVQIMLRGPKFDIPTFYDRGFYNTGIQRTANDLGNAGSDKFGLFSPTLRARQGQNVDQTKFDAPINALPVAINGTFKTPGLRNVELTGPYHHQGGYLFLEEVLEVYARGADFRNENADVLDQGVAGIPGLQDRSRGGIPVLAEFLRSLTDERVRNQEGPFDHPELLLPDGIQSINGSTVVEKITVFPAVGQYGVWAAYWGTKDGQPIKPFHQILREAK